VKDDRYFPIAAITPQWVIGDANSSGDESGIRGLQLRFLAGLFWLAVVGVIIGDGKASVGTEAFGF
jgi:hypothetical protein